MDNKEDLKKRLKHNNKWELIFLCIVVFSVLINASLHIDISIQKHFNFISNLFAYWITPICSSLGSLFLGLIIKENDSIHEQLKVHKTNYEVKQVISQSDIEQLIKLRSLLDTNILTEEEFKVKKKQLLGL
ncbi:MULTISPECIES: SHOCT domain-containing protein [Limosilactobacillus]|uniref:SHOCT domain-containing protein n=2 Tax=Limosilactobacillus reuteri TaxID=1598 RepID=A0A256VAY0_LIMRT|nr:MULTISPECIES: SHOCT domain-containing protein [Limosilactobacillus]MCD7136017.1 SHOCT domain-containing protein [Limosilactobacillus balticus]OYS85969.1 hypothetical protein CBG19_09075 [Limosilactobacillus reuteri]OYS89324.1 hypothetical protein CBG18_07915 [Limosilactobacillus reuteri]OYS94454.1 hypothetical protein CBG15_04295 [Limosilactobacillus reuteri]OYS96310.1 hypothetical protein CBG10_02515 [Limosilactobacillus reuteri]